MLATMDRPPTVTATSSLKISVSDGKGHSMCATLSRIAAQELAHSLLEYAGAKAKSFGRGHISHFEAEKATSSTVVSLDMRPVVKSR
jgi:hypothetical protein